MGIFGEDNPDLKTPAIVPAHPAAVALALLLLLVKRFGGRQRVGYGTGTGDGAWARGDG